MSEKNAHLRALRLLAGGYSPITALKLTAEDFQSAEVQGALKVAADALESQIEAEKAPPAPVVVAKKGGKGSRGPRKPRAAKVETSPVPPAQTNGAAGEPQTGLLS